MADSVKALFFDVFGTLVDWRTSIAREAEAMLKPLSFTLDWLAFADAWRGEYQGAMDEVRSGRIPFCKLDILHRRNLELILPRFHVDTLSEEQRRELNLAWHKLDAWPDVPPGLARLKKRYMLAPVSNGNISLMVDLARRNNLPWDAILGSGRRSARSAAARLHDGRRAHQGSHGRGGARATHRSHRAPQRARPRPRRDRARRESRFCREESGGFGRATRHVRRSPSP
jgi:2-haloalkanoic acid dehalogenase type II